MYYYYYHYYYYHYYYVIFTGHLRLFSFFSFSLRLFLSLILSLIGKATMATVQSLLLLVGLVNTTDGDICIPRQMSSF